MFNAIKIGKLTIHMYGLMIAIGFLCALWFCLSRAKKIGLEESRIWGLFYCALFGGLFGAKLLYIIVTLPEVLKHPEKLFDIRSGLVVYGGIIGGITTAYTYCKIKKINFLNYFDLVMPSVSLAQGFGRLGCFFSGCCYGKETDMPFGIIFKSSVYAPNNISLIPTQLISSTGDFLICLILTKYSEREDRSGCVGAAWMILYGTGRFIVEFFRNDYRGNIGFLSTSQLISIVILGIGIWLWNINHRS